MIALYLAILGHRRHAATRVGRYVQAAASTNIPLVAARIRVHFVSSELTSVTKLPKHLPKLLPKGRCDRPYTESVREPPTYISRDIYEGGAPNTLLGTPTAALQNCSVATLQHALFYIATLHILRDDWSTRVSYIPIPNLLWQTVWGGYV